ncbi:MAG: class I SAM-dependent methyltransferase [Cyanobacteria bacterium P01_A01_bin.135]
MKAAYNADLAYIHDAGFGHLAETAAPMVLEALEQAGLSGGTVVDLGCGSGITAQIVQDAGFDAFGIDVSSALIAIAQQRVPNGTFRVGSFVDADIPPCVAVTAIGEVLNYGFDNANGAAARSQLFERVYAALAPGGLLLFDVATPDRAPDGPQKTFVETPDWAVLVEAEADADKQILTRRITTFRAQGELYRRDREIHRLHLLNPVEITATLQQIGFQVQTVSHYGSLPLPRGLIGFLAQKPA